MARRKPGPRPRAQAPAAPRAAAKDLARVLSRAGLCSRGQAQALVAAGRVTLNGRRARDVAVRVDERRDDVRVDGRKLTRAAPIVLLLHKPAGYVTTLEDERGRATVYALLAGVPSWVGPVGRLDRDTTGLLLFTNDTALADRICDPRTHLRKTYRALVQGRLEPEALAALRSGVDLADGRTRAARVKVLRAGARRSLLELTLTEGRNRQVRRMVEAVGSRVLGLKRVAIDGLTLAGVPRGSWRRLGAAETERLRARAALGGAPRATRLSRESAARAAKRAR